MSFIRLRHRHARRGLVGSTGLARWSCSGHDRSDVAAGRVVEPFVLIAQITRGRFVDDTRFDQERLERWGLLALLGQQMLDLGAAEEPERDRRLSEPHGAGARLVREDCEHLGRVEHAEVERESPDREPRPTLQVDGGEELAVRGRSTLEEEGREIVSHTRIDGRLNEK